MSIAQKTADDSLQIIPEDWKTADATIRMIQDDPEAGRTYLASVAALFRSMDKKPS